MTMHKKDYERIASAIKPTVLSALRDDPHHGGHGIVKRIVDDLCDALKRDNARFDSSKFREACGIPKAL